MKSSSKFGIAAAVFLVVAVPGLLIGYAEGPDPRVTGAPGDDPNSCARIGGCHIGTAVNGGGGNVQVQFANGQTYVPGQKQTFTIAITDSKARLYGFQMTARLASDLANGQAGSFSAGTQQIVLCDNGTLKKTSGCPAGASVQFIEHSRPFTSNTIQVTWTPPATNAGDVMIYVAANAANGNGQNTGDHIYTANYKLTPVAAVCNISAAPSIPANGLSSAAAAVPGLTPGAWFSIYGQNLAPDARTWGDADFDGNNLPLSLDGVTVTIDNKPAAVYYISAGQLDVQVPDDANTGPVNVSVTNCAGTSNTVTADLTKYAPSLFTADGQNLAATHADNSPITASSPARPGETIVIYGTGFGPSTPPTPAGVIVNTAHALPANSVNVTIGGNTATVSFAGIVGAGLYQFNVIVPATAGNGDIAVMASVNSQTTQTGAMLPVNQ